MLSAFPVQTNVVLRLLPGLKAEHFLSADVPHDRLWPAAGRRRESQRAKRSWSYSPELKPDRLRTRLRNRRIALDWQAHAPTDPQDPRAVSRLDDCLRRSHAEVGCQHLAARPHGHPGT